MQPIDYRLVLKQYWGYETFRSLQEEIIRSVGDAKADSLGLLPTGGGKSVVFQVPAMAMPGICLVITPLIALMKDQVDNLSKRGIKAKAIYSGMSARDIDITLDNCIFGDVKFLYLSPERLSTDLFKAKLPHLKVSILAVDEAHCISQWGYDFRPSYLKLVDIRQQLPGVPVLALTATATPEVAKDIQDKLGFTTHNLFVKSFHRENLAYIVRQVEDKNAHLLRVISGVAGSGLVYVRSRKATKELAEFLQANKISADYYHAGLPGEWKDFKQKQWKSGEIRVIVATNAFGMGIDKSDVRFVVHTELPDSLEAYYQEAGRAGRDEIDAFAVLLYNKEDRSKLERQLRDSFPSRDEILNVYDALGNFFQVILGGGRGMSFDFDIWQFASQYKIQVNKIVSALSFLQKEGYIEFTEDVNLPSKLMFVVQRDDLYKLQVRSAQVDRFVKLVLRSYTGVFTEYVAISESMLAKKLEVKVELVIEFLKNLRKAKVIDYIPQRSKPLITYTEERLERRSLVISKANYEERQLRMKTRIEKALQYAEETHRCRSQILLAYFGETDAPLCGKCDYCRRKTDLGLSIAELAGVRKQILSVLHEDFVDLKYVTSLCETDDTVVINILRSLVADGTIMSDGLGRFCQKKTETN